MAITANCAFVETWAAVIIGSCAGALYCGASHVVLNVLKVDDPLDAVAVHGANGIWGLLAASAFATKEGVFRVYGESFANNAPNGYGFIMGGNGSLFACAVIGILSIGAWTVATMLPFFYGLRRMGWLRVAESEEIQGLDISHHGGSAYQGDLYEGHLTHAGVHATGDDGSQKGGNLKGLESYNTYANPKATATRLRTLEEQNTLLVSRLLALEAATAPPANKAHPQ